MGSWRERDYTRTEGQLVDEPNSLVGLFKEQPFRVPNYQCGYAGSWNLGQFREDLLNLLNGRSAPRIN